VEGLLAETSRLLPESVALTPTFFGAPAVGGTSGVVARAPAARVGAIGPPVNIAAVTYATRAGRRNASRRSILDAGLATVECQQHGSPIHRTRMPPGMTRPVTVNTACYLTNTDSRKISVPQHPRSMAHPDPARMAASIPALGDGSTWCPPQARHRSRSQNGCRALRTPPRLDGGRCPGIGRCSTSGHRGTPGTDIAAPPLSRCAAIASARPTTATTSRPT